MINISLATIDDSSDLLKLSKLLNKEYMESDEKIQTAIAGNMLWIAEIDNHIVGYVLCELFNQEHEQFPSY